MVVFLVLRQSVNIFQCFVELGSSTALVKELKLNGVTSKAWNTQDGGRISGPNGAAAQLGIPRGTLQHRMRKLGIRTGKDAIPSAK